jgi:transcriptional regulator ATRX
MAQEIADKKEVFLNIDPKTKEGSVQVDSSLVQVLKDYQLEGVQFMWDCCFESFEMIAKPNNLGSGCLLAHCMGLGKTLQVITLVHTLIAHKNETKCKRVLILMPVNVLLNWKHEFTKWTAKCNSKNKRKY